MSIPTFTEGRTPVGYNVIPATTVHGDVSTGNESGTEELYDVTPGIIVLLSLLYGTISVITVIGNALVILVIAKNKVMQTVTNFFIANLSVADVMIGIFSIPFQFQAALLQRWDLPRLLCPVAPFVKELTVTVSILTLTVISIDRYFAVIQPLRPRCSSRVARSAMAGVWCFSFCSSLPIAITFEVRMVPDTTGPPGALKPFCSPSYPSWYSVNMGSIYRLYTLIIQYFLPLLIISYAYGRIIHRIWLTKAPGSALDSRDQMLNRNKRKVSTYCCINNYTVVNNHGIDVGDRGRWGGDEVERRRRRKKRTRGTRKRKRKRENRKKRKGRNQKKEGEEGRRIIRRRRK